SPVKEIERKQNKIYEINMQLEALSERLGLLPKSVSPKPVFDQMEKLSIQKQSFEEQIKNLKDSRSEHTLPVKIDDFESFRKQIAKLLTDECTPAVKTAIIQKVVHRITIKQEIVEISFHAGESHYLRELELLEITSSGSRALLNPQAQKRRTSPLPVFHGNLETCEILKLNPNFFYDAGSNSLKIGSERRT
ncbi:MAG: hypothetical protein ACK5P7_00780, partial [Bdellovibrio sp.]